MRGGNRWIGIGLAGVITAMTGVSFAAVPLYRMFCQATGFGGTPNISATPAPGAVDRTITVRFNADTNPNLPWHFAPGQAAVTLKLGEDRLAVFEAKNLSSTIVTGVAVYNVTPEKVGKYFHKTACFCFNEQTLRPGQEMQFPVSFWIDPAIADDPNTADVHTVTLSYMFFRSLDDAARSGALAQAGPHVGGSVTN